MWRRVRTWISACKAYSWSSTFLKPSTHMNKKRKSLRTVSSQKRRSRRKRARKKRSSKGAMMTSRGNKMSNNLRYCSSRMSRMTWISGVQTGLITEGIPKLSMMKICFLIISIRRLGRRRLWGLIWVQSWCHRHPWHCQNSRKITRNISPHTLNSSSLISFRKCKELLRRLRLVRLCLSQNLLNKPSQIRPLRPNSKKRKLKNPF